MRTCEPLFVEGGDSWPAAAPKVAVTATGVRARAAGAPGTVPPRGPFLIPQVDRDLRELADPYLLEVSGRELTVFGRRALDLSSEDRVRAPAASR